MNTLDGKVALVTGGAGGIGAAIARRFASGGARVVIADVDPTGETIAREIGGAFVRTDVARRADNTAAVRTATERFGGLDIAVLNAGIGGQGGFVEDFRPEHYRDLVSVNLDGVVYGMHAALEVFTEQGSGAILATSSLAGVSESPINPLYAATKHAVIGLVRSVAPTVADRGVTVNALCPTFIDTAILGEAIPYITDLGVAVLPPERVAEVAELVLVRGGTGEAWPVVPHGEPGPFAFPELPSIMTDPNRQFAEDDS
ncbi:SDR family NAD(P)-dependent oxidoreductase [Rhodococcus triatomae]|uniref:NADP-dependent 3-hydroxy acid dehydrogenase YdfG n=1 Tax=Rhodococcus triatomae TaxID=300028 RepID=A0A1G8DYW6_9NOCA|nr:SDR family NAD(P)-dependent oxidoreductase [Rhodococcus triatomae]QNG18314.1 SDR family NAD(P)-dependent oxidoreductase [Rhodococcus triatomae]QNG22016.1 SDR family NAD(P)-dependent oxidoreductase [Rhodococcus triatomae]SDH62837.1 NADP-dependent 3-hydroxy acid dehydrogenase YdfG [Rhodococcus triatomae]